jgi:hypothetical protein
MSLFSVVKKSLSGFLFQLAWTLDTDEVVRIIEDADFVHSDNVMDYVQSRI